jgi:Flp pilus assembly protein CpaB
MAVPHGVPLRHALAQITCTGEVATAMARSTVDGPDVHTRPLPISPPAARVSRPRWRDARLVGGLMLVLLSVVLAARLFSSAGNTTPVWVAAHDLAAGSSLRPSDVVERQVRLESVAGSYLSARAAVPAGYVLARPIASGELVPVSAVVAASSAPDRRLVTVPVERFHRPADLRHGVRVDVYVTRTPSGGSLSTTLVLASATVEDVLNDGGRFGPAADSAGVVLGVSPGDVPALVAASRSGTLDLVSAG